MSAFAGVGRILFLGALCCSVAFLDVHSGRSASAPEVNENSAGRLESSENKSGALAIPQLGSYAIGLKADSKDNTKLHNSLAMSAAEISSKWSEVQTRIHADEVTIAACHSNQSACTPAARRFLSIVDVGRRHEGRARLGWLNRAANMAIRATSDWAQYGFADFWASPLQTMSGEAGDCEDYAIVKYAALRELGISVDDLRLVIVQDERRETGHAVVAVRYEQRWLILDNRTMAILNAEDVRDYRPLFALDEHGSRAIATAAIDLATDR